ncbi:MAG: TRAP transporter large permease, partial [Rhodospirillales bacterium]|nr:TRAP transporter large permease [Rhodospirillales bacterium]
MITFFISQLVLAFMGLPVFFALVLVAVAYLVLSGDPGLKFVPQRMIAALDSFPLLAVPFFILAANLMNRCGITERMFGFASAMIAHRKGGLGHVNVLASLLFSGMSGSAMADAAGLGQVEIKAMKDARFDEEFSGAVTAASVIIGPLVPPSIPMIVYGVITNVSIGALFLGGFVPGFLAAGSMMVVVYVLARIRNYPVEKRSTSTERLKAFWGAILPILTPAIIIGGIFSGFVTPTEAAVVACAYSIFLGTVVYPKLTLRSFVESLRDTVRLTAATLIIATGASVFGWVMAREGVPHQIAEALTGITNDPLVLFFIINGVLLLLGAILETTVLLFLVVPLLLPAGQAVGIDPLHFGVVAVYNMMVGILTPPFGAALFVIA